MTLVGALDRKIQAVAPIFGVAIGRKNDKSTWRIDFKPEATTAERRAAQDEVAAFDVAAEDQKIKDADASKKAARDKLRSLPDDTPITAKDLRDADLVPTLRRLRQPV